MARLPVGRDDESFGASRNGPLGGVDRRDALDDERRGACGLGELLHRRPLCGRRGRGARRRRIEHGPKRDARDLAAGRQRALQLRRRRTVVGKHLIPDRRLGLRGRARRSACSIGC